MKIRYEAWAPGPDARAIVAKAEEICAQYAEDGYDLTLRQLYYQFVARDIIPNTQESYNRLGSFVNRARLAGLLDWDYIVDRTRNLRGTSHWERPGSIISSAAQSFRLEKWSTQPRRVEIWVEKEALAGIVERVADRYDVDWFSCRGYVSQSEVWGAGRRIGRYLGAGQGVTILHLGDHDPSGIDMTRDIRDRLEQFISRDWLDDNGHLFPDDDTVEVDELFRSMRDNIWVGDPIEVRRIALNYDQVERYNPPPNPAKLTDSRANGYVARHGFESWELDALDPATLDELIAGHIEGIRDEAAWQEIADREHHHRALLSEAARRWPDVEAFLADSP